LSRAAYDGAVAARQTAAQARGLREQVAAAQPKATGALADALTAFDKKLDAIAGAAPAGGGRGRGAGGGGGGGRGGAPAGPAVETLASAGAALSGVMNLLQAADVQPTAVQLAAIASARAQAARVTARWNTVATVDLAAVNAKLAAAGLPVLKK
jgi:hypothetical protein